MGGGQASTAHIEPLASGVTYSFRLVAVGPGGRTVCPSANFTVPTDVAAWVSGGGISCGGIAWPISGMNIHAGTVGSLSAYLATDWDYRQFTVNGQVENDWYSDPCSYSWAVVDASGQPVGTFRNGKTTGQGVQWLPPSTPGTYKVLLIVDDQNAANQPNTEGGSRNDVAVGFNDDPVKFSATINVIP